MNAAILVWVLIVSPISSDKYMTELGPYTDLASCQRVEQSRPARHYSMHQCVQVRIPAGVERRN